MKNMTRFLMTVAAGFGLLVAAGAPALGADVMMDEKKLVALAKSANTPAEHATVAKQYRLRAEALEAKAAQHEEEARKLAARQQPPIAHKWPAMARKPWEAERRLAMQARRAAQEAFQIADRHVKLAVEKELAE